MSDVILRHIPIRGRTNYFSECLFLTVDKRERIKMTSLGGMPGLYRARGDKGISACIMAESQLKLGLLQPLLQPSFPDLHSKCCSARLHTTELCAADPPVFCTEDLVPDANLGSQVLSFSVQRFS